jgi:predicted secreted hydrolase
MYPRKPAALLVLLLCAIVGCSAPASQLPAAPLLAPTPAPPIVFPRDAGPHDALTEWWYYTGHLTDAEDGHAYGFEFVIFQVRRADQPSGYVAHFAISDIDGERFSHQLRFDQRPSAFEDFPFEVNGWRLDHQGTRDTIDAAMQPGPGAEAAYAVHLQLDAVKQPALHDNGYISYGPAGGSYYYSLTRLNVSGSLTLPSGRIVDASGVAWMDHQWGNFVISFQGGWDWYSLQLDDHTELMLYVLRSPSGETSAVYGSHVLADGRVENLPPDWATSAAANTWASPHTGAVYPSGWQLTLGDGRHLVLTPQLLDQELYFPGSPGTLSYWEGAVSITGDTTGVGYVELTGYAH